MLSPDVSLAQDPPELLDLDALLPGALDPQGGRIQMQQDLADLLRHAELRVDATPEPSIEGDPATPDLPVPADVAAMLDEPLETDEDDGAATGGATPAPTALATATGRPATMPGGMGVTQSGVEEDLEQSLPAGAARAPLSDGGDAPPYPGPLRAPSHPPRESPAARSLPPAGLSPGPHAPVPEERVQDTGHGLSDAARGATGNTYADVDGSTGGATFAGNDATWMQGPDRSMGASDPLRGPSPQTPFDGARRPTGRMAAVQRPRIPTGPFAVRPDIATPLPAPPAQRPLPPPPPAPLAAPPPLPAATPLPIPAAAGGSGNRSTNTEFVPAVLGPGDTARALGRAIAARMSGALVATAGDIERRVVLHDGDLVTAGSSATDESLVCFLAARGDIDRELVLRLVGKTPPFGRHAGAALVAHGYLAQDDLWPVLRIHAEHVIGRVIELESGACVIEPEPPLRYKNEPSVFGGATGAEVLVETMQRVVAPETAIQRLGGRGARFAPGSRLTLLGECALRPEDHALVTGAPGRTVDEVLGDARPEAASIFWALVCLGVIDVLPAVRPTTPAAARPVDPLDEEAIRARVRARMALVEEGDYFAVLGVGRNATSYEIRRAYLDLRRTFEPARLLTANTADLASDVRVVLEVMEEAYDILRDTHRRDRYRRAIEAGPPGQ